MALPNFEKNYNELQKIKEQLSGLVFEKILDGVSKKGWYRIAKIKGTGHPANTLILSISTIYNYNAPCSFIANIITSWKNAKITQTSAIDTNNNPALPKIRIQYDATEGNQCFYIDVYYNLTGVNSIVVRNENILKDKVELLTPSLVENEYTTLQELTISY